LSKVINDTDYLYISAFIWGHEPQLLNRERVERMLESSNFDDVTKVLEECGYGDMSDLTPDVLEERLAQHRAQVMDDLVKFAPDSDIVNVFRIKYDYHNAKVLIKAQASGQNGEKLMSEAGRVSPRELTLAFTHDDYISIPKVLASAMQEAKDTLARTADPQLSDFILDKAYYSEFIELAVNSGSSFLTEYGRLSVDSANLRAAVRSMRMNKDSAFLQQVLVEGGNIGTGRLINAIIQKSPLANLYIGSPLYDAAVEGAAVAQGGRLTNFERLCDSAVAEFTSQSLIANISEKKLVGYICSVENDLSAVRIIMAGRFAGLPASAIRERLRENYV